MPPLPNSAALLPRLDPERIALLRDLCSDAGPTALREMTDSWDTEVGRHIAKIRESQVAGDSPALKASAHALKGTCGNLGVARLAELGRLIELETANSAAAAALLPVLESEYEQARRELATVSAA